VGASRKLLRGLENALLDQVGLDVVTHWGNKCRSSW
jgi:hypothetical protein